MAAVLASAAPEADEQVMIFDTAVKMLNALNSAQKDEFARLVDPNGQMIIIDSTDPSVPFQEFTMRSVIEGMMPLDQYTTRLGAPTIKQRRDLAQLWAPYAFWLNGVEHHCGISSFTLFKKNGQWIVANFSRTTEPLSSCADLGAPETSE
jgi:hypothetical protein